MTQAAASGSAPAGTAFHWRRRLASNTLWSIGARIVFFVGWAVLTPALLATLGVERFAIWALFFTLSAYFATFDLGLSQVLVRFVAEFGAAGETRRLRGVVTMALLVYGVLSMLAVAGLWLARDPILALIRTPPSFHAEAAAGLVSMAVLLGAVNLTGVGAAVLNGRQRMDLANAAATVGTLVQLGGSALVVMRGGGLLALVGALAGGTAVTAVLTVRAVRRVAPEVGLDVGALGAVNVRELARYGGALQATHAAFLLRSQADKLLLAHFVALAAVTPFELAWRVAIAVWTTPALIVMPLLPAFSHLWAVGDRDRFARLASGANRLLLMVAFPLAGISLAAAPGVVSLWLGAPHPEVARAIAAMTAFWLPIIVTGVGTAALRARGTPGPEAWVHGLGSAAHLGLSLWLVPLRGLDGALLAMASSGVLTGAALLAVSLGPSGVSWRQWLAGAAAPVALSALAALLALALATVFAPSPATRGEGAVAVAVALASFAVVVAGGYAALGLFRPAAWSELRSATPSENPTIQK